MSSSVSRSIIAPVRSKGIVRSKQPIAAPRFSFSASNAEITCSAVTPISPTSKRSMKQLPPNKRFGQDSLRSCQIKGLATFLLRAVTSLRSGSSSLGMRAWLSLIVNPPWSSLARVVPSLKAQSAFGEIQTQPENISTGSRSLAAVSTNSTCFRSKHNERHA
jgi:hypothetical protein